MCFHFQYIQPDKKASFRSPCTSAVSKTRAIKPRKIDERQVCAHAEVGIAPAVEKALHPSLDVIPSGITVGPLNSVVTDGGFIVKVYFSPFCLPNPKQLRAVTDLNDPPPINCDQFWSNNLWSIHVRQILCHAPGKPKLKIPVGNDWLLLFQPQHLHRPVFPGAQEGFPSVLAALCQPERIKHLLLTARASEQPLSKQQLEQSHWPRASKAISPLISLVKAWLSQGEISHSPSLHLLHLRVHSFLYSESCSSIKRRRWMQAPDYSGGGKLSPT